MNRIYNAEYYESYFNIGNEAEYSDREKFYPFFSNIAEELVKNHRPETVLDVGCAFGYLVEALRERGVKAYGIDISEYAIENAAKEIRPYVRVSSASNPLPDDFPEHFDLIISIEVLEHMTVEEGDSALRNLCKLTELFVFSSSDNDLKDVTHINVQRKEYWARIFAQQGFYRDVQMPAAYIGNCADVYRKRDDLHNVIQEYEVMLRIAKEESLRQCLDSQLYYDLGDGFKEENKFVIKNAIRGERIQFAVELSEDIKTIRFDPTEDFFCILSGLSIRLGEKELVPERTNGTLEGEMIFFDTTDPQIIIRIDQPGRLVITGEIYLSENLHVNVAVLFGIMKKIEMERKKEWEEIKTKFYEQKKKIERESRRIGWIGR